MSLFKDLDWKPMALVPVLALAALPAIGSPSTWLTLTVAGLAMGMIVFIIASGLTLVFGLMDVLNFGHGVFIALGAFVATSVMGFAAGAGWGGLLSIFAAMLVAMAVAGAVGERRALFNAGWSGIDATQLPANFHAIGHVPHDWLLPRCALAIHHGGSGTTHSACRAGIPSVMVPFAGDQFFWNARLRAAGVMHHALKGATITADALGAALAYAGSETARNSAKALGQAMQAGDALTLSGESLLQLRRGQDAEVLVFDLGA